VAARHKWLPRPGCAPPLGAATAPEAGPAAPTTFAPELSGPRIPPVQKLGLAEGERLRGSRPRGLLGEGFPVVRISNAALIEM